MNSTIDKTLRPYVCDDCHWRMGWLHDPGQYWCAVRGAAVGDGKSLPAWCPTDRAYVRDNLQDHP